MNRFRTARQEQSAVIATALSMSHHFYAVGDWGTEKYGLAVISRFPLVHIQSGHLTPANSAQRAEARGALWVSIQSPFGKLNIINTHFGLKREERQRQADILLGNDWLGNVLRDEPVIVCGDFNAQPRSQVWKTFCRQMRDAQQAAPNHRPRNTFASIFPAVRIDHIFVNEKLSVKSIQQPRTPTSSVASDHLPICAELKILAFPPTGK
jgi:endonuclease/exonuclease/phosphatase family metal-dependent hydrolase